MVRAGGMEDDVMLGRMNGARKKGRPKQRWLDTLKGYSNGAIISNIIIIMAEMAVEMRRDTIERDGEELSPGVGCDSTAQGDITREGKSKTIQ